MRNTIHTLSEKYQIESICRRLQDLANSPTIRIGFIGEFSAGKTSLINSVLGTHLPVDIKPTTKAICLIEPTVGIERNVYLKEEENQRIPIDFNEFQSILNGEKDSVAVVQVPPCEVLPSGCVFVDTPGIHTASGSEAELTYGYLSMMDAAVACINITDGTIGKEMLDFICSNQLKHLQKHLVFAVTWSDKKSPKEAVNIKDTVIRRLKENVAEGKLDIDNIEEKVFTISSKEIGNAEKLYAILKNAVLEDLPTLHEQRKRFILRDIGHDLLDILLTRQKMTTFDASAMEEKLQSVQQNIRLLQNECRKREEKLTAFEESLNGKVRNILQHAITKACLATGKEAQTAEIVAMNAALNELLRNEAKNYLGLSTFSDALPEDLTMEIISKLQLIDEIRDIGVTAGTAIVTAWICPGASTAANAAEAAAGAAASAAVKTTKAAAGAAASTAAKTTKAAASSKGKDIANKILGTLGSIFREINPVEHIGDICSVYAKKNMQDNLVSEKTALIVHRFIDGLETPYQEEVLRPLVDKLEDEKRQLSTLTSQNAEEIKRFRESRNELRQDIQILQKALEEK